MKENPNSAISVAIGVLIGCWIIAATSWLGYEPLINAGNRYGVIDDLVSISRAVTLLSCLGAAGIGVYLFAKR